MAWCALALGAIATSSCRARYEVLELLSGPGGDAATGGDESIADSGSAGAESPLSGGGQQPTTGATGGVGEGGGPDLVGGTNGAAGDPTSSVGGAGGSTVGGGSNGGGGGSNGGGGGSNGGGGGGGVCVPDATCDCQVFEGHDYRFCAVAATRDVGLAACQAANMTLIRIDSAEENAWLLQQFLDHGMFIGAGSPIVILGGTDIEVETTWRWEDGTAFWEAGAPVDNLYTNWSSPPKAGPGDCLGMSSDGKWDDRPCNSGNATVACESP